MEGLEKQIETANGQALIEAQKTADTRALVLMSRRDDLIEYKTTAAKNWLRETVGIKLSQKTGGGGAVGSGVARLQGINDGRNTSMSKTRLKKLTG